MKKISNYLCYMAVFALIFTTSCSKEENVAVDDQQTAILTFGTALQSLNSMNKQQDVEECVEGDPAIAQLTIEYGGNSEMVLVPILGNEDDGYFTAYSEDLEIPVPSGNTHVTVELTDFVVWTDDDDDGTGDRVLWVAPKVGSDYAQFVTNPLGGDGYTWNLRAGSKTYTDVEVLCFDNREVNRYGYQFFDITPTNLMKFCMFGNFCPPSGRHYTASYTVDVWEYTDGNKGDQLYFDEPANVINENGEYYADPLCFFLPDREGQDTYWFEVTLRDSDQYDGPNRVILEGPITDDEIKNFYNGESGTMEYYHFQYGCEEDTPPPFYDPEDEAKHYKACLNSLNDSKAVGFAYFSVKNNVLETTVLAANLEPNKIHPQHIHGFMNDSPSTCPPTSAADDDPEGDDNFISVGEGAPFYGGILLSLTQEDGTWPMANAFGILTYQRTFTLPVTEGSGEDAFQVNVETLMPLENRAVVLHGMTVGEDYIPSLPVACGKVSDQ